MSLDPGSGSGSPMSERMQALLSRAVEDQLTEQRQVANLVADVRNQLAQLGAQVDALRASPPGANDELQHAIANVSGEVRESIRVLGERIDGVGGLVHQRGQDLAELRGVIDSEMRPRVDALDGTMREMRGAFAGIAARVADLPVRADVESMIGRTGEGTADLPERIERLEDALAELHDGVLGEDGLHARIAALSSRGDETDLAGTIAEQVAQAVHLSVDQAVSRAIADSERRLGEHIDEAVLALAEALLRRRPVRQAPGPFDTGEIQAITAEISAATTAPAEPIASHEPEPEPEMTSYEDHFGGSPEPDEHAYDAPVIEHDAPVIEHNQPVVLDQPEHATVSAPADLGLRDALEDDDESRKRRPWWRPGD